MDQAIEKYLEIGKDIFGTKKSWWDATYDHATLESCLKNVIKDSPINSDQDPEMKLKPPKTKRCRTFVITTTLTEDEPRPVLLRDYDIRKGVTTVASAFPGKIWEAGRSTSAAPTFFRPISVETADGPRLYSDGGTISNNPIVEAIVEACRIWEPTAIDLIVSLGAGPESEHTLTSSPGELLGPWMGRGARWLTSKKTYFQVQLASYAIHAMTGTERLHHRAEAMIEAFQGPLVTTSRGLSGEDVARKQVYFRLNPIDEKAQVPLDAYMEMGKLMTLASYYMKKNVVALVYKKVILANLFHPKMEWNEIPLSKRCDIQHARRVLKKDYQIRMHVWPQGKPKQKHAVQAMYNQYKDINLISENLAQALVHPFENAPHGDCQAFQQDLNQVIHLDVSVESQTRIQEMEKMEKVEFYVAKDLQLPYNIILGSDTFKKYYLQKHLPQKDVRDGDSMAREGQYNFPVLWGNQYR